MNEHPDHECIAPGGRSCSSLERRKLDGNSFGIRGGPDECVPEKLVGIMVSTVLVRVGRRTSRVLYRVVQ